MLPGLVCDPVAGCVDPLVAERLAKAFAAGTAKASIIAGHGDSAARLNPAEADWVFPAYLHAAAFTGRTLDDVLRWVAPRLATTEPSEILHEGPHAAPF